MGDSTAGRSKDIRLVRSRGAGYPLSRPCRSVDTS